MYYKDKEKYDRFISNLYLKLEKKKIINEKENVNIILGFLCILDDNKYVYKMVVKNKKTFKKEYKTIYVNRYEHDMLVKYDHFRMY